MSSIIVVNNHHYEFPLILAANRDAEPEPQSKGIQVLERSPHLIVGEQLGDNASWFAVNKHSLFALITNQGVRNPNLEGRGKIVIDALRSKSLDELLAFVEGINIARYSGFNLLFGDQRHVYLAHSFILKSMAIRALSPGVHLVSSDMPFIQGEWKKAKFVHNSFNNAKQFPWIQYYAALKHTLANKDYGFKVLPGKPKAGATPGSYTQSSSILAFSADGLARFKFHDRSIPRARRKAGEPFVPRYKDYIDMWRAPDGQLFEDQGKNIAHTNEEPELDAEDAEDNASQAIYIDSAGTTTNYSFINNTYPVFYYK